LFILSSMDSREQGKIPNQRTNETHTASVKSRGSFELDPDAQNQLLQIQELIDIGQMELLASVLEMPSAATDTKIAAAEFLASQNDIRGLRALEKLTADQTNSDEQANLVAMRSVPHVIGGNETDLVVNGGRVLREIPVTGIVRTGLVVDKSLDGKKAVVRIYDNWKENPETFKTEEVKIKNRKVDFNLLKLDTAGMNVDDTGIIPVVAVFGPDQSDPNVAEYMINYVCANTYQKDLKFTIPGSSYGKRSVIFNDASTEWKFLENLRAWDIGLSIPEANVKVYLISNSGARICLGEYKTGSGGDVVVPYSDKYNSNTRLKFFEFVISQPDYGTAKVSNYVYPNGTVAHISLPLVKSDSELVSRTARGYIVDSDGFSVAGAEISCSNVRTLGDGLINSSESNRTILTGEDGSFRFYVLSRDRTTERGSLVPPKSTYHLRIEPPDQTDLLPLFSALVNDKEHVITMDRGDVLRYFAFYDDEGLITDPKKMETLNIHVRASGSEGRITLYYDHIKNGAFVPYGMYRAVMYYLGQETEFRPVEISADSDELVAFTLPDVFEYHGRVTNGITGVPMQDVIVFAQNGSKQKSLAEITDEEWDLLHLGRPDSDNPYGPLDECYNIKHITRTDENGQYTMRFRKGDVYGIYALEQYFLPVMQRDMDLKVDEDNRCEIPTLKLFPAAKLAFKLTVENPVEAYKEDKTVRSDVFFSGDIAYVSKNIWPRWSISSAGNPEWTPSLLKCDNRRDKFIQYARWLRTRDEQSTLFIPADTTLKIKLDPSSDTLSPMHLDVSPLQQGQVKDIGEIRFSSRFQIALKIVDSQGNPREGVPLRQEVDSNAWDVVHNSDENGLVFFYAEPHSINTFGIHYHGGSKPRSETIDIETTTSQETPKEFTMVVSDEMLQLLFD